jgi:asparagine synthase (glutamine-hydrolysing)
VDPGVIQFAASLPPAMKVRGRQLKYLLRKVAARYLPREIVTRPKQGFGFPLGHWMRGDLRAFVSDRLRRSKLVDAGIFRHETVVRLLEEHMDGRVDHSYRLWLLLGLEIWYEIYIEGRAVGAIQADIIGSDSRPRVP